jgi:hypothetical protein
MPEIPIAKIYEKIITLTTWTTFTNGTETVQVRRELVQAIEREANVGTMEALGQCANASAEILPDLRAIPGDYRQLQVQWDKPIKRTVFWLLNRDNEVYLSDIQFVPFDGQDSGEVMRQWEKKLQPTPPAR